MPDKSGNAYALTILSPIRQGHLDEVAYADVVRSRLDAWNFLENSPMARVPQTYLCRYFVLDDVFTQSLGGGDAYGTWFDFLSIFSDRARRRALPYEDHLKSKYLVFSCNFHGDLDTYLRSMWLAIGNEIRHAWEFCYAFDQVRNADDFVAYMKKCQLNASLFFVGSNDDPLEEQLKALYLKQEFGKFVVEHQGLPADQLQQAYRDFVARVEPANLAGPTWSPGQYRLR
ncbi:hypothetical protein [Janthinobacterium sp. 17J80-10]|uniref:hypothetical protein n=1 Tax=Janthinobacterium sp. 17J80-10 TaxID=2497863 RepID=UPI00100547E0|nr:hypothetical protein [Janthinobacterium sp. 17J80-10]QAU35272.1 hypothetical protein EKL02_14415 [Janthinobacterium sp. 17J80-10]